MPQTEALRQALTVVLDGDDHPVPLVAQLDRDGAAGLALVAVLHRILQELVDHQGTGRRLLSGQVNAGPLQGQMNPLLRVHDAPLCLVDDMLAHILDIYNPRPLLREEVVHHGHAQDAVHALQQGPPGLLRPRAPALKPQQGGDDLQVVLHPVVDLLDHGRFHLQLPLLAPLLRLVVDGQHHPGQAKPWGGQGQEPGQAARPTLSGGQRDGLLDPDAIPHLHLPFEAAPLPQGSGDQALVARLQAGDGLPQQAIQVAHLAIEVGGDAADVAYPPVAVHHQDAVVLAEGREVLDARQLSPQKHGLQPPDRSLEDLAAAAVSLVLDEVGLNAQGGDDFPLVVADGIDLLHDGGAVGYQSSAAAGGASQPQGAEDEGLLVRRDRPSEDGFGVDGGDGVGPGLGHHHRPIGGERAVDEHVGPADVGHDGHVVFYLL